MDEKLTFAQRVKRIDAAARDLCSAVETLTGVLEVVESEAAAMRAAEQRFAAKKPARKLSS